MAVQSFLQIGNLSLREGRQGNTEVVGLTGFEPVTLRLSSACSNQLSYRPWESEYRVLMVEARGFEPLTYSLQSYRSTN